MYGGSIASSGSGTVLTANCRGIAVRERVYNWLQSLSNIGAFWAILGNFWTLSNVPVTYSPLVEWKNWKVACFPHFDSRFEREKWSRFEEIKFEEADHGNYISYELITRSSIKIFLVVHEHWPNETLVHFRRFIIFLSFSFCNFFFRFPFCNFFFRFSFIIFVSIFRDKTKIW